MNNFYPLSIREVRAETRDAVSLCFDLPEALQERFRYQQGQHLVLRTAIDGEEVRRSYSICTGVADRSCASPSRRCREAASPPLPTNSSSPARRLT